jgi:hypothetical protein
VVAALAGARAVRWSPELALARAIARRRMLVQDRLGDDGRECGGHFRPLRFGFGTLAIEATSTSTLASSTSRVRAASIAR